MIEQLYIIEKGKLKAKHDGWSDFDMFKAGYELQQAEITRLKEQNDKFRSALVEVISPDIHYDVMLGIALRALSEDK